MSFPKRIVCRGGPKDRQLLPNSGSVARFKRSLPVLGSARDYVIVDSTYHLTLYADCSLRFPEVAFKWYVYEWQCDMVEVF